MYLFTVLIALMGLLGFLAITSEVLPFACFNDMLLLQVTWKAVQLFAKESESLLVWGHPFMMSTRRAEDKGGHVDVHTEN